MLENNETDSVILPSKQESPWHRLKRKRKIVESSSFPREWDCDIWLEYNALISTEQLADLRYAIYHCRSQGAFTVSKTSDRQFELTGAHSTLTVPNEGSRQYLVSQLRKLTVRELRRAWRRANFENDQ